METITLFRLLIGKVLNMEYVFALSNYLYIQKGKWFINHEKGNQKEQLAENAFFLRLPLQRKDDTFSHMCDNKRFRRIRTVLLRIQDAYLVYTEGSYQQRDLILVRSRIRKLCC